MPATRSYDIICFGDEVPGVLALVSAAQHYEFVHGVGQYPKTLLISKAPLERVNGVVQNMGGHLVRGWLAYLDRCCLPKDTTWAKLIGSPNRADASPAIYRTFLNKAGVQEIALDPNKASRVLHAMLTQVGADVISGKEIQQVNLNGALLESIGLSNGEVYAAKQFIDCTVNAELAQKAGVPKTRGFGSIGLENSELAVTQVYETTGLSINALKQFEQSYLNRLLNPLDSGTKTDLNVAAGNNESLKKELRSSLIRNGSPNLMGVGGDYIDVFSKAMPIAYHAYRGTVHSLSNSPAVLDNANVAVLDGNRLLWNSLLLKVNADQAEKLALGGALPDPTILPVLPQEQSKIKAWFQATFGSQVNVRFAPELYIRHAGNVINVVQPLSGAQMLMGGVPRSEAIGSFCYDFDVRGGVAGMEGRVNTSAFPKDPFKFKPELPIFNIGIQHALVKGSNLAVISPASGFTGLACAVGRIVEFNVAVGQGVGVAAAIALSFGVPLSTVANQHVRAGLDARRVPLRIFGRTNWTAAADISKIEQVSIA
ncbi:MAG TPA: FAD-dependent oxidoreductase [Trichocoleus sp.]|jgi:hypothetical protein